MDEFYGTKNQKYLRRPTYSILIHITDEGGIIRFCPFTENEGKDGHLSIRNHQKTIF